VNLTIGVLVALAHALDTAPDHLLAHRTLPKAVRGRPRQRPGRGGETTTP
jgi:hypothetical protein